MSAFLEQFWDQGVDIATLVIAFLAMLAAAGFFRKDQINRGEKKVLQDERDDWKSKYYASEVQLDHVHPERFIDKAEQLYRDGKFKEVEEAALDFTNRQSEAFGRAAEYLAEQYIIDSDEHPELAEDAARFAEIGKAAFPDSKRLEELQDLAAHRKHDVARGDPIEALNMRGMSDYELNRLSIALQKAGKYVLAEVAARRSVPLALARTGEKSANYIGALVQHGSTLRSIGDFAKCETVARIAMELSKDVFGAENEEYARSLNNLALVVQHQGRYEEAESLYRQALEIDCATVGVGSPVYAEHLGNLASAVQAQGRYKEAEGLYRQALEIDCATIGKENPNYATRLANFAANLAAQGKAAEARPKLHQALSILRATLPENHPDIATALGHIDALPPE